mgnify:CR=1 FL=1
MNVGDELRKKTNLFARQIHHFHPNTYLYAIVACQYLIDQVLWLAERGGRLLDKKVSGKLFWPMSSPDYDPLHLHDEEDRIEVLDPIPPPAGRCSQFCVRSRASSSFTLRKNI